MSTQVEDSYTIAYEDPRTHRRIWRIRCVRITKKGTRCTKHAEWFNESKENLCHTHRWTQYGD